MKLVLIIPATLVFAIVLTSCEPKTDSTTASAAASGVSVDGAINQIARNWSQAESWVPRVNAMFKEKQAAEYKKAQTLYDTARTENNSWLELLVTKIKAGQKPEKSAEFQRQSKAAAEATQAFVDYAKSLQPTQPKPGIAVASAGAIIDLLVKNGFKIWTEYSNHQQAQRNAKADDLAKRLRWPTWEKASS